MSVHCLRGNTGSQSVHKTLLHISMCQYVSVDSIYLGVSWVDSSSKYKTPKPPRQPLPHQITTSALRFIVLGVYRLMRHSNFKRIAVYRHHKTIVWSLYTPRLQTCGKQTLLE